MKQMNPQHLEKSTLTQVAWRIVPFICLLGRHLLDITA
jgi:hypothetical protein